MDSLELALVEKANELIRKERLTPELFDILDARIVWLIHFCQRNAIDIPNKEMIVIDEARIKALMDEISPDAQRPFKSPEDATEPILRS